MITYLVCKGLIFVALLLGVVLCAIDHGVTMNAETKDNGVHTWVDLLNNEEPSGSNDGGRFRGVKISSRTPRATRTASRLTGQLGHGEVGQAEGLRAQVMSLLKDKQELRKKVCVKASNLLRLLLYVRTRQVYTYRIRLVYKQSVGHGPAARRGGLSTK